MWYAHVHSASLSSLVTYKVVLCATASEMMMEVSGATVSRSGSFRKRRLETRPSDGTDLPTKHERAPSETEMDFSPSPTKLASTGSNAVIDEVEQHFQRSLAKARSHQGQQGQLQQPQQPQQASKSLVILHPSHPTEQQNHTPPSQPQQSAQPSFRTILPKPDPSDAHDIVVAENSIMSKGMTPMVGVSSSGTMQVPTSSIHTLQSTNGLAQPIVVSAPQAAHMISTSSPLIPATAQSSVQIIDLTRNLTQKYSTSSNVKQKAVLTDTVSPLSTPTSQKAAVSHVPSLIQMTHTSMAQPLSSKKSAVPAVSASTGLQSPRIETRRTHRQGLPQSTTPTRITPQQAKATVITPQPHTPTLITPQQATTTLITPQPHTPTPQPRTPTLITAPRATPTLITPQPTTPTLITPQRATPTLITPQPTTPTLITPQQATPTLITPQPTTPTLMTPQPPTPTLTPQQASSIMPLLDPTTSQLVAGMAGMAGNSPIILLPSGGNVPLMQTQSYFLVNPNDLSGVSSAPNLIGTNANFVNTAAAMGSIIPNPSTGGYIVIPPGTTFPTPLMNLAGINGSQQPAVVTTPLTTTTIQSVRPQNTATIGVSQLTSTTPLNTMTVTTVNPLKRTTRGHPPSLSDKNDVMNMTPASVEDHFAKALGDQWSKLQSNSLQSQTVAAAQP